LNRIFIYITRIINFNSLFLNFKTFISIEKRRLCEGNQTKSTERLLFLCLALEILKNKITSPTTTFLLRSESKEFKMNVAAYYSTKSAH